MRDRVAHDPAAERPWTFLSTHALVLVAIDQRPDAGAREIATDVGIGEGAVRRILTELVAGGYVQRRRSGNGYLYGIDRAKRLRHALVSDLSIGSLLAIISEPRTLGSVQAELARSRERYRQLVEHLPVVVYRCFVLSGAWDYISPAIESLVGCTAEEWHAHPSPWKAFVHPDDLAEATAEEKRALAESRPLSTEYRLVSRDGREVWVHDNAFLVDEGGERQWHGVLSDVTQRRGLEDRLRQSQKLEVVGQLAGGIAHDFNNLLVAMSGYAELAATRVEANNPELRHEIEQILLAASKARDLTSRLLAFSRKEACTSRVLDLNEVVASAHPMLRRLIGADVELCSSTAPAPCMIEVDSSRLEQALLNLAINARDAMPDGGTLTIATGLDESGAFLRVEDTGIGISEQISSRLFEPFFTTKEAGRGTGLGLATIREFVEECGGSIEVDSVEGHGAVFTLRLPRVEADAGEIVAPEPGLPQTGSETILLAEDNDAVRDVTARMLERAGYAVRSARDGAEALELAARDSYDLLLTDVVMPGLSGPKMVARLRERSPQTAVLFMSGYAPETEGSLGQAELVRKPFTPAELLEAVGRTLAARTGAAVLAG